MRFAFAIAFAIAAAPAIAQDAPPAPPPQLPAPDIRAVAQKYMQRLVVVTDEAMTAEAQRDTLAAQNADLQKQLGATAASIADLQKQLAAEKVKNVPATPADAPSAP